MATNKNDNLISDELMTLKRIEELLALIARAMLAERLDEIMSDKSHRALYNATGRIPRNQLAKRTGMSAGTISGVWKKWEQIGLIVKDGKQYRKVL
jgi:DNA-binding MarR family transcriptional regulator